MHVLTIDTPPGFLGEASAGGNGDGRDGHHVVQRGCGSPIQYLANYVR